MMVSAVRDAQGLLGDLDPEQRAAVEVTRGPLAILAGAGSGKTRVVSRRVAYAIATGAVEAHHILVVTFTDKAAGEMRERITSLGHPTVATATFHSAAFRQLRHFWPLLSERPLPEVVASKMPIVSRLQAELPGGYRFVAARDLVQEIEWAKARRLTPTEYARAAQAVGHDGPLPSELFTGLFRRYEAAKERAGLIDFEDMLAMTVGLLEQHEDALAQVRSRHRWFSVDEYQDTNALQQSLLDVWRGDREDIGVVGDVDQTIYSFTGASSEFLTGFAARFPGARVIRLERNYRSTPEVLGLANRLLASVEPAHGRPKRLVPTLPGGAPPVFRTFELAEDEARSVVAEVGRLHGSGVPLDGIAVLLRTNAQLPEYEERLRAAGIAFQVRGERFFQRPEVRTAMRALETAGRRGARSAAPAEDPDEEGDGLVAEVLALFRRSMAFDPDEVPQASGLRDRHASLVTLVGFARSAEATDPAITLDRFARELVDRAASEADGVAGVGVALATFHRAKGLEWEAVFLPALEEGLLPIRQAADEDQVHEERRLLYVGITRARTHLWLSWARRRVGPQGREVGRRSSRFLAALVPGEHRQHGGAPAGRAASVARTPESEALRTWRTDQARATRLPPYVILHDATLEAIVSARPRSIPELRRVKGMGPTKLERYGAGILAVLVGPPVDAADGDS